MSLRATHKSQLQGGEFDVLVIGAGINGAVSAYALAHRGLRTALVDAKTIIVRYTAKRGGGIEVSLSARGILTLERNDVWQNAGGDYSGASPGPGSGSVDPLFHSASEPPRASGRAAATG